MFTQIVTLLWVEVILMDDHCQVNIAISAVVAASARAEQDNAAGRQLTAYSAGYFPDKLCISD